MPAQTPQQFADKQILRKTRVRINNLLNNACATRATKSGSKIVPDLNTIRGIRKFVFRLEGSSPELKSAVGNSIKHLENEFPSYTFEARYGGK